MMMTRYWTMLLVLLPVLNTTLAEPEYNGDVTTIEDPAITECAPRDGLYYVSQELSYISDERTEFPDLGFALRVIPEDEIAGATEKVGLASNGLWQLKCVEGTYLACPAEGPQVPKTESALDTLVELSLDNVSTWDALKAIVAAVNSKATSLSLEIHLSYYPPLEPDPLFLEEVLSLRAKDRPAREVLCEVLRLSPVPLLFVYFNLDAYVERTALRRGYLALHFYEGQEQLEGVFVDDAYVKWWFEAMDTANKIPAELLERNRVPESAK